MRSDISKYPAEYSQLLAALEPNGNEFIVEMNSPQAAMEERLQYYNFLRFCRRNPQTVPHLGNRINTVVVSVRNNLLIFKLRVSGAQNIRSALAQTLAERGMTPHMDPAPAQSPSLNIPDLPPHDIGFIPLMDEPTDALFKGMLEESAREVATNIDSMRIDYSNLHKKVDK